jgi:hypothetical protein
MLKNWIFLPQPYLLIKAPRTIVLLLFLVIPILTEIIGGKVFLGNSTAIH